MIILGNEQYHGLSKVNKAIYNFIAENYAHIPFLSINELSAKIGVSPASITRFARKTGYSGYPDLLKEIQDDFRQDVLPMQEIKACITEANDDTDVLLKTIEQNIKNLQNIDNPNLRKQFSNAVDIIAGARKNIYIFGMRSSFTIAYYLSFMLAQFMGNVILLESGKERLYDRLSYTTEQDVLFAVSISRYTRLTIDVAKYFHSQHSSVIALTDSATSPLAVYGSVNLILPNMQSHSFASTLTLLNALSVAVAARDKQKNLEQMKRRETLVLENQIYL